MIVTVFFMGRYDIGGEGACLKRYTDPSFMTYSARSSVVQEGIRRERMSLRAMVRNMKCCHWKKVICSTFPSNLCLCIINLLLVIWWILYKNKIENIYWMFCVLNVIQRLFTTATITSINPNRLGVGSMHVFHLMVQFNSSSFTARELLLIGDLKIWAFCFFCFSLVGDQAEPSEFRDFQAPKSSQRWFHVAVP
jgi:hypothetical protein